MTCDHKERELLAEVRQDDGDRVTVERCTRCEEIISRGTGTMQFWVQARARRFASMREEAYALAGLPLPPA